MRRFLAAFLILCLVAGATACTSDDQASQNDRSERDDDTPRRSKDDPEEEEQEEEQQEEEEEEEEEEAERPTAMSYAETLELAIADIETYWDETFPAVFGTEYQFIDEDDILAAQPGDEIPSCGPGSSGGYTDVEGNAYYCPLGDFIAYDDEFLFPQLFDTYGDVTLAIVLAHEWGHRIQNLSGVFDDPSVESVLVELQADCYAGAWSARVASGESDDLQLAPGALEFGLAGVLGFRDFVGSTPDDPAAHGSGFDRVNAFQEGVESGAARCAEYFDVPPEVVQMGFLDFADEQSGGNLEFPDAIEFGIESLNVYWPTAAPGFVPIESFEPYTLDDEDQLPECGENLDEPDELENVVFFCPADGFAAWDEDHLLTVYASGITDISGEAIAGDFGVITVLASAWSSAVQTRAGLGAGPLATDCLTGSWAGALFRQEVLTTDPDTGEPVPFLLSPGDLDESVAAILQTTLPGERDSMSELTGAFERIQAFRTGFSQGVAAC